MTRISFVWAAAFFSCAALAALAAWQGFAPVSLALPKLSPAAGSPAPVGAIQAANPQPLSRESYAEIAERPLFVPTRRPPAVAAPTAAHSQTLDAYSIVGIVAAPDRAVALIHGPTASILHLRKGETLEGWTLETIEPNKLVFVSGEQHQTLEFKSNKAQQNQVGIRANTGVMLPTAAAPPSNPRMPPQ
jgi:hypothetical protein